MYSRLQLGLKAAKTVAAFLSFLRALANSSGSLSGGLWGFDDLISGRYGAGVVAAVDEGGGLAYPREHLLVGREIFDGGDAAERAHAFFA